ncbi:hypothetical protein F5148DRAFT_343368 [Russula earlei]|uniref:Uncharacterized protein n=1 Tax=Russula earlei TaxID=71964 RepID=A0ACC0U1E3_9AGAM|nr:hypothetical protein F5148DRAFT_343368 [Russula earlei]
MHLFVSLLLDPQDPLFFLPHLHWRHRNQQSMLLNKVSKSHVVPESIKGLKFPRRAQALFSLVDTYFCGPSVPATIGSLADIPLVWLLLWRASRTKNASASESQKPSFHFGPQASAFEFRHFGCQRATDAAILVSTCSVLGTDQGILSFYPFSDLDRLPSPWTSTLSKSSDAMSTITAEDHPNAPSLMPPFGLPPPTEALLYFCPPLARTLLLIVRSFARKPISLT